MLKSAIDRPYQTFNQEDLYKTPIEKAAAIIESVIKNHPFLDGNKRTGYVLIRLILLEKGLDILARQNDKYDFVVSVASGELSYDQIKDWIKNHMIKK